MSEAVALNPRRVKLEFRTAYGPVYRDVLTTPPREARADEIPIIDITDIHGDLQARRRLSEAVISASENTGFFYIKNHGISQEAIDGALNAAKSFFSQPEDMKKLVSKDKGKYFNGYTAKQTALVNPTEGLDYREAFMWLYQPKYDPDPTRRDEAAVPAEVRPWIRGEDFIWDGTSHLPHFRDRCLAYYQECLTLSRRLVRLFALGLDLPEDYFDNITTYPGADGVFNFYPGLTEDQIVSNQDVGIGSHTDLQCFTLLWQDSLGGLQVLSNEGQWLKASPVPETFVVNIGDFLMRLTNDRLKSTVHRVYNRSTTDRYSMPFFFGFNFNEKCGVLPECTDENNPPKYEPISCGEWCQLRFAQGILQPKIVQT